MILTPPAAGQPIGKCGKTEATLRILRKDPQTRERPQ